MESHTIVSSYLYYLTIFICLIVSAFFSFSETAITSLGTLKAKHLYNSNKRYLPYLKLWLTHPGRILSTILIFNNITNILASSVATQLAYTYSHSAAIGIATGLITVLVLVFGEILPKSFAKAHAEKFALPCLQINYFVYYFSYPLIRVLSDFADFIIRAFSHGRKVEPLITEEELEFIVSEGKKAGVIGDMKKSIIDGAFDFDETKVREIMTPRMDITAFEANMSFKDMLEIVIKTGYSRIPVYRGQVDHVIGMVLVKDLLRFIAAPQESEKVIAKAIMREALFSPESKTIMEVFKDLQRTKSHLAIIIDEYGGTAGLVTMEDILEEFVGEIQDEFDTEQAKVAQIENNVFHASGSIHIDEFIEFFKLKDEDFLKTEQYDQQDVDTLAGWITQLIGQMPRTGQKVTVGPLVLEVIEVKNRRINLVKVEITQDGDFLEEKPS
jgi:putative hemolysin